MRESTPDPAPPAPNETPWLGREEPDLDLEAALPPPPDPSAAPLELADDPAPRPMRRRVAQPEEEAPVPPTPPPTKFDLHKGKSRRREMTGGVAPMMHLQISTSMKLMIAFAIIVPAFAAFMYFGPMQAHQEWDAAQTQGQDAITSVVTRAMQAYLATNGAWDQRNPHWIPEVSKTPDFFDMPLMIRMPDKVGFVAVTTEGNATGFYYTRTGEVEADMKLLNATLHITGHEKDGNVESFINGQPAIIPPPPPLDQ